MGVAGLVRDPLLIDGLVQAGKHAEHVRTTGINADVGANCIHDVDGLGAAELPRTSLESVRLRGEGADGTEVDDVARHLRVKHLGGVGADLHVVATAGGTKSGDTGYLGREADATSAVNAASHDSLDNGTEVLIFYSALNLTETRAIGAIVHRLLLKIALTTLVTNGAIQGVVREEELHDTLTSLVDHYRVGLDAHVRSQRVGARGNGLGNLLDFNQAHTAVTSDRETLMEAEARDILTSHLTCLQNGGARRNLYLRTVHKHGNQVRGRSRGS